MAQITVPTAQAEAPVGGGDGDVFPKGDWQGTIEEVRVRDFPEWAAIEGRGYGCGDGEVLSIQIGSNQGLNGESDIGARKHFVDFVIRDGDETPETCDVEDRKCACWQLQKGTRLLANLGMAMGETETLEDENGASVTAVAEDFLDNLKMGAFEGTQLAFTITHRPWKTDTSSGTEVITREFFQAV